MWSLSLQGPLCIIAAGEQASECLPGDWAYLRCAFGFSHFMLVPLHPAQTPSPSCPGQPPAGMLFICCASSAPAPPGQDTASGGVRPSPLSTNASTSLSSDYSKLSAAQCSAQRSPAASGGASALLDEMWEPCHASALGAQMEQFLFGCPQVSQRSKIRIPTAPCTHAHVRACMHTLACVFCLPKSPKPLEREGRGSKEHRPAA